MKQQQPPCSSLFSSATSPLLEQADVLSVLVIGSVRNTSAQAHAGQAGAVVCKAQQEMCKPAKSGMYFCQNEILHIHALKGLHFPAGPGDTSDSSW